MGAQLHHPERDIAAPNAASLVESLRAFGYGLPTALADLLDNSLFAGAKNIWIQFHWAGENSAIAITDDGRGMDEPTLLDAMRLGSRNPRDDRHPDDLGRFGLGLKTASFSQCRCVTVRTCIRKGSVCTRRWDLDHISRTNSWQLLRNASPLASRLSAQLAAQTQGTCVVWENLDRLVSDTATDSDNDERVFLTRAEAVRDHLATVFHRFLDGSCGVRLSINGRQVDAWDPFLSAEPATLKLGAETLLCAGSQIHVVPYVLPHLSRIDPQTHRLAAGQRGWNAHQGFYVYRNRRLIVAGDWLGIRGWRQEDHYKLARILLDLPNALDDAWQIDVTKSRAIPPPALRDELARIGEYTRSQAKRVYSHRGAKLTPAGTADRVFLWEQRAKHNKVFYRLNREHPLLRDVTASCSDKAQLGALLRLIEETIPVPLITISNSEQPDRTSGPFESAKSNEILQVMRQVLASLRTSGLNREDALKRLGTLEPFPQFPELLAMIAEEEDHDDE